MTRNQIDQMTKRLNELRQIVEDLDCGPLECHACVDTEDYAYIEVAIDGDGAARSLTDWAFALETLVDLAHTDWAVGELYTAFRLALQQTSASPDDALPEWEEVEQLMAEQARLRDIYFNLLYLLENPDEYAVLLRREVEARCREEDLPLGVARSQVAAQTITKLHEEIEMAYGEKATPQLFRAYQAWTEENGDFAAWVYRALGISRTNPIPTEE